MFSVYFPFHSLRVILPLTCSRASTKLWYSWLIWRGSSEQLSFSSDSELLWGAELLELLVVELLGTGEGWGRNREENGEGDLSCDWWLRLEIPVALAAKGGGGSESLRNWIGPCVFSCELRWSGDEATELLWVVFWLGSKSKNLLHVDENPERRKLCQKDIIIQTIQIQFSYLLSTGFARAWKESGPKFLPLHSCL